MLSEMLKAWLAATWTPGRVVASGEQRKGIQDANSARRARLAGAMQIKCPTRPVSRLELDSS
jgi:hypothetical protein